MSDQNDDTSDNIPSTNDEDFATIFAASAQTKRLQDGDALRRQVSDAVYGVLRRAPGSSTKGPLSTQTAERS